MDGNCALNGQEEVDLTITHRVITAQIKFVDLCGQCTVQCSTHCVVRHVRVSERRSVRKQRSPLHVHSIDSSLQTEMDFEKVWWPVKNSVGMEIIYSFNYLYDRAFNKLNCTFKSLAGLNNIKINVTHRMNSNTFAAINKFGSGLKKKSKKKKGKPGKVI